MDTIYRAVVFITTDKTRKIHLYLKSKNERDMFLHHAHKKGLDAKGIGVISVMTWQEALQKTEISIKTLIDHGD